MALRRVLVGAAIGLTLVLGTVGPAVAADRAEQLRAIDDATGAVSGQSWSAPAFPVDCFTADAQITCTPQNPSDTKAQQCFIKVLVAGKGTTLCTTYESHIDAVKAAGGRPLLVEYGCSLGDVVCLSFENAGRGMALSATGAMFAVAQNMRFDTSSLLWTASTSEWSFWQWAILIVTFGAMVWAIAAAVVSGDRAELVGALVRTFIAIPAVPLTLWLTGHLLNAVDEMVWYLMNRDGAGGLFATLQGVMWAGGQANYFFAFLIHGLLMIGVLLLMLVFAFRNIALAALIAVGPIAWMLFPIRGIGPQWVVRYVSAIVVLLLTGPLTIGFVTLIINGLSTVKTIWNPQSWPLVLGLALVAFAPFAIFGLFSFVGAVAADGMGSRLGSHAASRASSAARTVTRIPTRLGGRPAGIPASTTASASSAAGVGGSAKPPTSPAPGASGKTAARTDAAGTHPTPPPATTTREAKAPAAPTIPRSGRPGAARP